MNYRLATAFVVALAIVAAVSAIIVANDDPGTPVRVRVQPQCPWTIDDEAIRTVSIRTGALEQTWVKDDNRRWHFDQTATPSTLPVGAPPPSCSAAPNLSARSPAPRPTSTAMA